MFRKDSEMIYIYYISHELCASILVIFEVQLPKLTKPGYNIHAHVELQIIEQFIFRDLNCNLFSSQISVMAAY